MTNDKVPNSKGNRGSNVDEKTAYLMVNDAQIHA